MTKICFTIFLKVHFHELLSLLENRCSFALLRCLVCVDLGNSPLPLWDAKKFIRLPLQSSHTHGRGHRRARKVGSGITNSFCLTHLVFTRPVVCFVFLVWLLIIRNFGFRKRTSYCYGFLSNFSQHPIPTASYWSFHCSYLVVSLIESLTKCIYIIWLHNSKNCHYYISCSRRRSFPDQAFHRRILFWNRLVLLLCPRLFRLYFLNKSVLSIRADSAKSVRCL